jgi:LacI family transcriptional regulator
MVSVRPPSRARPTQADVARRAGVSQSLVSYVLNDSNVSVPEATRQKVRDAILELGYEPNHAARALRTRRSMTIALVIPDITNPFYPAVERGAQQAAEEAGYQIITYNTDGVAEKERAAVRWIRQRAHADGAVIYDFHLARDDYQALLDAGVAVAIVASSTLRIGDLPVDRCIVDTAAGAERITTYLIERGYDPIATITGPLDSEVGAARLAGFRQALAAAGIQPDPRHIVASDHTYEGGLVAMAQLLSVEPRPRAVFAANDLMALGAMGHARDEGVRVPEDVAIAGFDDIDAARMVTPRLTTIHQPQRDIGGQVVRLLLGRLSGDVTAPAQELRAKLELVVRESA